MDLPGMRDRLPFWTHGQSLSVCSLKLLVFPKPEHVLPSVEVEVGEDKITVTQNEKFLKDYGQFKGDDYIHGLCTVMEHQWVQEQFIYPRLAFSAVYLMSPFIVDVSLLTRRIDVVSRIARL